MPETSLPCRVKFGAFLDHLETNHKEKFDRVASGHYARLVRGLDREEPVSLHMTPDVIKDQTYFLASLSQEQLSRVMFPIGSLTKVDFGNNIQALYFFGSVSALHASSEGVQCVFSCLGCSTHICMGIMFT